MSEGSNSFEMFESPRPSGEESENLQGMNLSTNPSEDDLVKQFVRHGRLSLDDALEMVDSQGRIIGSKVLPHAEARYLEELALEEAKEQSALSSPPFQHWMDDEESEQRSGEENVVHEQSAEGSVSDSDDQASAKFPHSVQSLYNLIEPERENEFRSQVGDFNRQLDYIQTEICLERTQRLVAKTRKFAFEKEIIEESITEGGILYLPGNFLEPIIGRRIRNEDIAFIIQCVKNIQGFKGFNFAYNEISDEGMAHLATFVGENNFISHLNMAHNDFTTQGLETLIACLLNRAPLHSLKMTGNKIGDEGISSITCLYMAGKGPLDLDVSETDMTMPGFQALCTAFQAIDEDEDYPKYLTKHRLPYTLETLSRLKYLNTTRMKRRAGLRLRRSHFELIPPSTKNKQLENQYNNVTVGNEVSEGEREGAKKSVNDGIAEALEPMFTASLGAGQGDSGTQEVDLEETAEESLYVAQQSRALADTDAFMREHQVIRQVGCVSTRPDGKPVIVCPSLYSLVLDEFSDELDPQSQQGDVSLVHKRVNPLYMDTLVQSQPDGEVRDSDNVADTWTAEKASLKFVGEVVKEAGGIGGVTDYSQESDSTQILLITVLETAKKFLEAEADGGDLSSPELEIIWKHAVETSLKIFRPAIPNDCTVTKKNMKSFVKSFMNVFSVNLFQMAEDPILFDLFEEAATKGCIEERGTRQQNNNETIVARSTYIHVQNVVLKFLEKIIEHAAQIIGAGDPQDLRGAVFKSSTTSLKERRSTWPMLDDITEEMVEPLVDNFFAAGAMLAQDAITYKEESKNDQEGGIEPAKLFLEGIFDELVNFLYHLRNSDEKAKQRMGNNPSKFSYVSRPIRIVLNRPFFSGYEPVMASKLAAYLRHNESVKCLHLRKWSLGEDGMVNLMDGLVSNNNIVTLDLASNGIGAEGMRALGDYLKRNKNLKHLLLNHNRLRNPGIQLLSNALADSNLLSLNVAFNDVSDIGLNPFLRTIPKSKLRSLYILGNCFSQESWLLLQDLFKNEVLNKFECDVQLQEIDGQGHIVRNAQARDMNEWYEVPAAIDVGLTCPPFYMEHYSPPKTTMIYGSIKH